MRHAACAMIVAAAGLSGCVGTAPSIGVSDPRLVDSEHFVNAQRDLAMYADLASSDEGRRSTAIKALSCAECQKKLYVGRRFVLESLADVFTVSPEELDKGETVLQRSGFDLQRALAHTTRDAFSASVGFSGPMIGSSDGSPTPPDTDGVWGDVSKELRSQAVFDSATDAVDRWHDVAMWYFVRHLAANNDSRRSHVKTAPRCEECPAPGERPSAPIGWHYYGLMFDVHVSPGSQPDRGVGVRMTVLDTFTSWEDGVQQLRQRRRSGPFGARPQPGPGQANMLVTQLFPTRIYDVSSFVGNATRERDVKVNKDGEPVSAEVRAEASSRALQRFLSRTGKQASFADASKHQFGWDFYPSNFQRFDRSVFESMGALVFGEHPGGVQAFLEAGGRPCIAFTMIRSDVRAILVFAEQVVKDAPPREALELDRTKSLGYFLIPVDRGEEVEPDSSATGATTASPL